MCPLKNGALAWVFQQSELNAFKILLPYPHYPIFERFLQSNRQKKNMKWWRRRRRKNQIFAHLGYTSDWCTHINVVRRAREYQNPYVKHGINGRFITFPKSAWRIKESMPQQKKLWRKMRKRVRERERTSHLHSLLLNENDFVCLFVYCTFNTHITLSPIYS